MATPLSRSIVCLLSLCLLPVPSLAWERVVAPGSDDGGVFATTVDPSGDALVVGGGFSGGATPGFVAKLSRSDGSELWRHAIVGSAGGGSGFGVLADGGDVYVVGTVRNVETHDDVVALKLSGADGHELWRHEIDGSATTEPGTGTYQHDRGVSVAVGPDGDPVFAATVYHWQESTNVLVIKFARATGAELWRKEIDGGVAGPDHLEEFEAFALAADGDPVFTAGLGDDFGIVRLAAATGDERWRYLGDTGRYGIAVGLDQNGNIVAIGGGGPDGGEAVKVDGAGNELWRHNWGSTGDYGVGVAFDDASDVFVGAVDGMFAVLKLAGSDGTPLWRYATLGSFPWEIGVDSAGNVVAAGGLGGRFGVVQLAGTNGAELWRYERPDQGPGEARGAFFDAEGRVVAGGWVADDSQYFGFVLKVAPEISGKSLAVGDAAAAPTKRSTKFRSQQRGLVVPTQGGSADPTVAGATLDLYNPVTGELATASLPAAQWQAVARSSSLGYRFKGSPSDACQKVGVSDGKLEVACKGAGLGFSLDEATQGTLGIRLTLGSAPGIAYCAVFGGTVARDAGTVAGGKGTFKAKSAPAPASCVVP